MAIRILLYLAIFLVTPEEYWVARTIEGEGVFMVDDPETAASLIYQTMLNRKDAGWCTTLSECAISGFHGTRVIEYPTQESVELARRIIGMPHTEEGVFFAFSFGDVDALCLDIKDAVITTSRSDQKGVGLAFFNRKINLQVPCGISERGG